MLTLVAVILPFPQGAPGRITLAGKVSHVQVTDRQSNDGGLVQLAGDGSRQREHLGQLEKLKVLFPASRTRCISRLLLPQVL